MQSLTEQFKAWVRTKPADKAYDYGSNRRCAFCQFLQEHGYASQPWVGGSFWTDDYGADHPIPSDLIEALVAWTFGDLAERLDEQP